MSYDHVRGNKQRGLAFLNAVLLYLHGCGQPEAYRVEHPRKLSQALREDLGDIDGIRDWALTVCTGREDDLSGQLVLARDAAATSGKPFAASIRSRRGYGLGDSYVVMTLETFGRLLPLIPVSATDPADTE